MIYKLSGILEVDPLEVEEFRATLEKTGMPGDRYSCCGGEYALPESTKATALRVLLPCQGCSGHLPSPGR